LTVYTILPICITREYRCTNKAPMPQYNSPDVPKKLPIPVSVDNIKVKGWKDSIVKMWTDPPHVIVSSMEN